MADSTAWIIGAGRVGTAFAHVMKNHGIAVLNIISAKYSRAQALAARTGAKAYATIPEHEPWPDWLALTVRDDVIADVVELLDARVKPQNQHTACFHCSGVHGSSLLKPLAEHGWNTFSFHPIQTFYSVEIRPEVVENIYVGIEGDEPGLQAARRLADTLGWKPMVIPKDKKALYHAACVFASNFITANFGAALDILASIGIPENKAREALLPLSQTSLNALAHLPPHEAITGPLVRGDVDTVENHLRVLSTNGLYRNMYKEICNTILEMLQRHDLSPEWLDKMQSVLKSE